MDSVLQFLLILFQISGLYLGPVRSPARLLQWPHCYTMVVTMAMFIYSFMIISFCLIEGKAVPPRRFGSDDHETERVIEDMKPITSLATVVNGVFYQLVFLQMYSMTITQGQRIFQLPSGRLYRGLENCWPLGLSLVGVMLGFSTLCISNYKMLTQGILRYFYSIFQLALIIHYYFNIIMHLYSLIQYIRCLRREYLVIQSDHQLERMVTRLPKIVKIISHVHHTNRIMSSILGAKLRYLIIQIAFSLFYVTFQSKKPLFVENIFYFLGYQVFFIVVLFLLAELLMHVFDQITRCLNTKLAANIHLHRWHNPKLPHWRVQWFLLVEQRHYLQLRILPNVTIRFAHLITIAFFTWDLSILLYQTEFM